MLATKSLKQTMAPLARAEVLLSLACAVALVGAAVWWESRTAASPQRQAAVSAAPAAPCTATNQAFCPTQAQFERFVRDKDFSGIVEQQNQGAQQFVVEAAGKQLTFDNRNDYIAYLKGYFAQYGPFTLARVDSAGNSETLVFSGQGGHVLTLTLAPSGDGWQITSVQTT